MPRTLEQAVQILDRDLEEFLNRFPLSIFSAGQQKGVVRYYLYSIGETALGLNHGVPMLETKLRLALNHYPKTQNHFNAFISLSRSINNSNPNAFQKSPIMMRPTSL